MGNAEPALDQLPDRTGAVVEEGLDAGDVSQCDHASQGDGAADKADTKTPKIVILVMMDRGSHTESSMPPRKESLFLT